ncbi:Ig-like domain-containing protein [Luteolibacter soli]|uniref:Ig-like domain-containing protein n=1 Tax=Luteolibacter soli TaxID=3135280 RepID=A0ABU9AXG9_9BACT
MTTSRIVALLGACTLVHSAHATLIAGWETTGQNNWGTQGLAATQKHSNVTVGGLTRGSGVDTGAGSSLNGWGGEHWNAESYDDGIAANRFITFTITPGSGSEVSIETFTLHYRRSTNGPLVAALQFKIGNGAYIDVEEMLLDAEANTAGIANDIDLSSIQELQDHSGSPITFRLIPYLANDDEGDFYVWGESPGLDLTVQGTVTGSSGGDTTPPTLSGVTPNDNATNVPAPATLTAVFNENIARGTGSILVKEAATGTVVNTLNVTNPAQVGLTVNQINLVMANPLTPGTDYYVVIPEGAIVDLAGNPFAGFTDSESWNFTTLQVIDPPEVVVNKFFNGSPDRVELLVTGNGEPGSTVDLRGMILKEFSGNIDTDLGSKLVFSSSPLWSAVPVGTLVTLTNWASSPDVSASDFTLSVGLTDPTYFTPVAGSPEFDLNATEMIMIKHAGSDPAGTSGGIHALAAGSPSGLSFFATYPGAKVITDATTGANLGAKVGNATATLADYMSGTDASGGLLLSLDDFGSPNNGTNAAFIAALRGRTAGQGDGVATVTNGTLDSALLGLPAFDAGQTGRLVKVSLLAQASTAPLTQVRIVVPAALGTPTGAVLSGPASAGASVSRNGQTIQVNSAAITKLNALEITISGLSTPASSQVSNNGIYPLAISTTGAGGTLTPIPAQAAVRVVTPIGALHDTDADGLALDSGLVVAVSGTVSEEDFGGGAANFSGFLQDASGGINISSPTLNLGLLRGYRFTVLGTVVQTNGQTSIVPTSATHIVDRGPVPEVLGARTTLPNLFSNPELKEGSLITLSNLVLDSGTWGPGTTATLRDPLGNTIDVRIQPGSTATSMPSTPIVITGIVGQSDGTSPFTGSYFLMPRDPGDAVSMTDVALWRADHGVTNPNSAADDDGDGRDNAYEYAFGLDPRSAASSSAIVGNLDPATGKFSFTRRPPAMTGLSYRVFTSSNLTSWTQDGAATLNVTSLTNDVETVEVTLGTPAPLPSSSFFIRVETP